MAFQLSDEIAALRAAFYNGSPQASAAEAAANPAPHPTVRRNESRRKLPATKAFPGLADGDIETQRQYYIS